MSEPSVFPDPATAVRGRVAETHTAIVVFVGDRAYKAKKPVSMGFLDFGSRAARYTACERELSLNRRFAPDVYIGLAEIAGADGDVGEPIVVMRRMDERRRLAHLVGVGADIDGALRDVARLLAACHADARREAEVAAEGTRDALGARWEASFQQVRVLPSCGDVFPYLDETQRLVRRYLAGRQEMFADRIRQGRVVDGHGDLLAEDVFCLDDGPRVLDCLEFDDRLRYVDGLDDAAFLAMDLEHLGAAEAGAGFLDRYGEFTGDPSPPSLRHHYIAYRAFVRAKVSHIQASQGAHGKDRDATSLAELALRHLRSSAVGLVLVGGTPGSGKSTLSEGLADRLGACLLSSDRLRKELAGISPEQPAPAAYGHGIYTPARTRQTYELLLARAATLLARGETVVLDASWSTVEERRAAAETARRADADLLALRCDVPEEVARARTVARTEGVSDADAAVAAEMSSRTPPWPEATAIDTSGALSTAVDQAAAVVRPHGVDRLHVHRRPYMEPS